MCVCITFQESLLALFFSFTYNFSVLVVQSTMDLKRLSDRGLWLFGHSFAHSLLFCLHALFVRLLFSLFVILIFNVLVASNQYVESIEFCAKLEIDEWLLKWVYMLRNDRRTVTDHFVWNAIERKRVKDRSLC